MTSPILQNILTRAEHLHAEGHLEQAITLYKQALQISPTLSRTAYNLGIILIQLQDYYGAAEAFTLCLTTEPSLLEARLNLAFALQEQGRITEALARYQSILSTDPACIEARFNLACLQLLQGNLVDGLNGYELRFSTNDPVVARHQTIPVWPGTIQAGLCVLIHAEQGYGDTIQMLRYLPLLVNKGLDIVLEVPTPLFTLCCRTEQIRCIERGAPVPAVDYRLPVMSLPRVMGTTLTTIPSAIPYLTPDTNLLRQWRRRLPDTTGLRVGLAWAGRYDLPVNRKRSCPPALLLPLLAIERISFISLQLSPPEGFQFNDPRLFECSSELTDFNQTAALIASLDLVITIDTATAHLAGALGIPTWLMLPAVPDWRWLLDREDSPWYPSMRIFRQPTPGAWEPVIAMISRQLGTISMPKIWCYQDGQDFDNSFTSTRLTPLSDRSQWPSLGIIAADRPDSADWLLFPYYLEHLAEYQTIEGMWRFLELLQMFNEHQNQHLFFSDHDCEAPYHSTATWFRASVSHGRHDPAACIIPYQIDMPTGQLHFDLSRIRFHISFVGFIGLLRERTPLINGIIAEPRLVHKLDLSTSFHLHQSEKIRQERRQSYLANSGESICVLCPRGDGSSSIRFFETLALGRIPVIQEPMLLPFCDRIDYTRFVISIPENRTHEAGTIVYNWLAALRDDQLLQRFREARAAWEHHLSPEALAQGAVRQLCKQMLEKTTLPAGQQQHRPPEDWQQPLNRAAILLLEGNPAEAHQLLTTALSSNPRSAIILVTLAGVEQELGNDRSAEIHLQDAILYNHRCYDAYLQLGSLLARTGRAAEAIGRLYQASLLKPDETIPYQLALPLLLQQGRLDEAAYCRDRLRLFTGSEGAA